MKEEWKKYESSPIEFFHSRLLDEFHKFRKQLTENTSISINGSSFNEIVTNAKKDTYEKYQVMKLDKAVLKTELWNRERVKKCFDELGFDYPQTEEQLQAYEEKFKDYPYKLSADDLNIKKILNKIYNKSTS